MHLSYLHYLMATDTAVHHARQFAAAARSLGHRVDLNGINLAHAANGAGAWRGRARRALKQRFSSHLHLPKELVWNFGYARLERSLLASTAPDVLLVRNANARLSFLYTARRFRLPLVLEMNAPAVEAQLFPGGYWQPAPLLEALERYKLRRADRIVVVSSALRDFLAERHGVAVSRFAVAPNGADVDLFRPDTPADRELAERLAGSPVVGFVGSFEPWHGSAALVELARRVCALRPQARVLYVGDGPEAPRVHAELEPLGERVVWTGRVPHDRVPGVVATLSVAVLPACAFYMSPLKVLEWMAAGRAVVAPDHPPLREILEDGREGLLFAPGDVEHMIACVVRLLDDPGLRRQLGAAAAERVRASLTWRDNARIVLGCCADALAERRVTVGEPAGTAAAARRAQR